MAAHQAPLSLGFSRQEYWSGLPFPSPTQACMLSCFSRVQLCATPWTPAHQALLSTGFSRQEYWSELPFPSIPEDICSIFGNEKVSARFNLFLAQISPPTVLAHPNWHGLPTELHSPSQKHSSPQYVQLWQGASTHLKSTAIRI